jgi:hypothetical protein
LLRTRGLGGRPRSADSAFCASGSFTRKLMTSAASLACLEPD